jgi:outer membrane immunogenic protein
VKLSLMVAGVLAAAMTTSVSAADMPARVAKAPAAAVVPVFNWSGFYVGASAGGIRAKDEIVNLSNGFPGSGSFRGFLGGPTVGVNWQSGTWVFGVEGDYSWSNLDEEISFGCTPPCVQELPYFATARVRIGHAAGGYLGYLTGGAAFTHVKHFQVSVPGNFDSAKDVTGWTIGAGLEGAVGANWSWKVEYLFADFGNPVTFAPILAFPVRHDLTAHVLRVGINYRFNTGKTPSPVVTKF